MKELFLDLPNGAKLKACIKQEETWKSIDINLIFADGSEECLCAADYDEEIGLRVFGMHPDKDDYEYCQKYPIQKRSIVITDERADDGTWDIDVSDSNGRDDNLSISRLPSFIAAMDAALVLMKNHPEIKWDVVGPDEFVEKSETIF